MPLKRKLGVTAGSGCIRRAGLFAVLAALLLPATASAADSIYWSRERGSDSIRVGNLDGTPAASTLFNDGGCPVRGGT